VEEVGTRREMGGVESGEEVGLRRGRGGWGVGGGAEGLQTSDMEALLGFNQATNQTCLRGEVGRQLPRLSDLLVGGLELAHGVCGQIGRQAVRVCLRVCLCVRVRVRASRSNAGPLPGSTPHAAPALLPRPCAQPRNLEFEHTRSNDR
jgi:hypothetical protein